jgi:hypothetical protein
MKVFTKNGLVERDLLVVKDVITEEPNCRIIATEWYLKSNPDGEHVRRDCNVNIFSGQPIFGDQGAL